MQDFAEKRWIKRCRTGDEDACEQLYQQYMPAVYGFCLRMLNNKQDAEDAAQNAFIRFFRTLAQFKYRSTLRTYLMQIAKNVCYDQLQKRKTLAFTALEEAGEQISYSDFITSDLKEAISLLPDKMRAIFILFAVEGFKIDEISAIMAVSAGTVKATLFQARKKLRAMLTQEGDEQ